MANDMNRRGFLKYAAASALGMGALGVMTGCSSKETASSSAASTSGAVYTPGTYTASAEGYGSDVTVTVTFDETSITNVVVDSSGETENVGAAAAEKLADQVLSAQSSAIDGVTGATKTSKAVKQAVADCISQASGGAIVEGGDVAVTDDVTVGGNTDWLGTAPEVAESDITETIETDVLVVGAGNAGLMTAARAASQGAKVLVIEKGMSSMNERHWIGAVGTTAAKEAGVEVDKNKLVAELCRYASHRCDERLIRLWVNHSGEAMDWYQEVVKQYNPDVKFHMEWDVGKGGHDTYYVPATMHNFQDDIPEHDYSSATAEYGFASLQQCVTDNGGVRHRQWRRDRVRGRHGQAGAGRRQGDRRDRQGGRRPLYPHQGSQGRGPVLRRLRSRQADAGHPEPGCLPEHRWFGCICTGHRRRHSCCYVGGC